MWHFQLKKKKKKAFSEKKSHEVQQNDQNALLLTCHPPSLFPWSERVKEQRACLVECVRLVGASSDWVLCTFSQFTHHRWLKQTASTPHPPKMKMYSYWVELEAAECITCKGIQFPLCHKIIKQSSEKWPRATLIKMQHRRLFNWRPNTGCDPFNKHYITLSAFDVCSSFRGNTRKKNTRVWQRVT